MNVLEYIRVLFTSVIISFIFSKNYLLLGGSIKQSKSMNDVRTVTNPLIHHSTSFNLYSEIYSYFLSLLMQFN